MSLPIIRLRTVDFNAATAAEDPLTASCTLYSFLCPVATSTECQVAMDVFKNSVRGRRPTGFFSRSNARILSIIDASVQDVVFRHPPKVIPSVARSSQMWRKFLRFKKAEPKDRNELAAEGIGRPEAMPDGTLSTAPGAERLQKEHLLPPSTTLGGQRGSDVQGIATASSAPHVADVVREVVPASAAHFRNLYGPVRAEAEDPVIACYLSTDTTQDVEEHGVGDCSTAAAGEWGRTAERPRDVSGGVKCNGEPEPVYKPHPELSRLLQEIRETLPPEDDPLDKEEREFSILMESKAEALHRRLESAMASIPHEEAEALSFLRGLKRRVAVAEKLFEVERHEQETIQIAHCALMIEVEAMRRVLRDVMAAVQKAEERLRCEWPPPPYHAQELHLMATLQKALECTLSPRQ